MLDELKRRVCEANLELVRLGLVFETWGNASAIDRARGLVIIKPSGVDYGVMAPKHMAVVDLDGRPAESTEPLKPSVDTATHLALYRAFPAVNGAAHTHSHYATCFAQARRAIPCLGTTHADYFHGEIPLVPPLTEEEVSEEYERHIGEAIARRYADLDPMAHPAALAAGHGPFAWGATVEKAVEAASVLETVAWMAAHTLALDPQARPLESYLLDKHYLRKHGQNAYYGQTSK